MGQCSPESSTPHLLSSISPQPSISSTLPFHLYFFPHPSTIFVSSISQYYSFILQLISASLNICVITMGKYISVWLWVMWRRQSMCNYKGKIQIRITQYLFNDLKLTKGKTDMYDLGFRGKEQHAVRYGKKCNFLTCKTSKQYVWPEI
jgi:hypothetical protein